MKMPLTLPTDLTASKLKIGGRFVQLTNLKKIFFPDRNFTKLDLLTYYAAISPWLLPHLKDRAMVMKRYPGGVTGPFFFMKRAPDPRPDWIQTCSITHSSGSIIDFPMVQDLASLLWIVNLGCIDLNQWYAKCDDVDRPDYLHFDLDPVPGADFEQVRKTAILVRDYLADRKIKCYPKTTGSRGIHIYVPIIRGPIQKEVWTVAKRIANELAQENPKIITAEYRIAKRPAGRVLVDYNQNAWGRTLASVYSVRAVPRATVSAPLTWQEVERGFTIDDFDIKTMPKRLEKKGDLSKPLLLKTGRVRLDKFK